MPQPNIPRTQISSSIVNHWLRTHRIEWLHSSLKPSWEDPETSSCTILTINRSKWVGDPDWILTRLKLSNFSSHTVNIHLSWSFLTLFPKLWSNEIFQKRRFFWVYREWSINNNHRQYVSFYPLLFFTIFLDIRGKSANCVKNYDKSWSWKSDEESLLF